MKTYEIDEISLNKLLKNASRLGAVQALIDVGMTNPTIGVNEAIKKYGKNNIKLWEKMKIIERVQKGMGAKQYFSVSDLNQAALHVKRYDYLTVKERNEIK
ncbi:hypothetical protein ACFSQ3_12995 [Sphingobacterium corticis]|uniref:Uncharacterized protein n=1 Tax=Sphingobacterium corticis TaxID=1812823 RepID=A0ABW5NMH8_9SPHI